MDEEGLAIVCSTLGAFQENASGQEVYEKHEECLESLKDLQRYMRRDHPESRDVFMQLGKWNIVRRDIVPLILRHGDEHELVLNCVKVLVFLTMPIDPASHQVSLQVEYLQHFRAALLDEETIPVIMSLLEEPLQRLERGAPKEDDWKMLQLFLTLLRNLLAIPDSFTHHISISTQYAFLKERLLEILFNESVMELVVALTQHTAGRHGGLRHDNFLILEILHHVLTGERPEIVAAAADKSFKVQKNSEKSSVTLRALMLEEKAQLKSTRYDPALHAPFSGMFVRVAKDGTKTILTRTPHQSPLENVFRKPQIRRGPIKRVVAGNTAFRPTNDHLQVLLKDFVNQFLASGYNVLMQSIKDDLRRERPSSEAVDPVPFFQVVQFFTAYLCRITESDKVKDRQSTASSEIGENGMPSQKHICGSIASTLDEEMFVLVKSKWCQYIDEAQTTKNWGPVAAGVAVMKDMIHMLDIVLKRPGPIDKEAALELRTARILLYKVFYDQTDTGIIQTVISLLKGFDIHKQPRSFLADLVEITHIVLRMLEAATKEGTLRVLKKVRGTRKKDKAAIRKSDENVAGTPDVKVSVGKAKDEDEGGPSVVATWELGQEQIETLVTENVSTDDLGVDEGSQKGVINEHTDNLTAENTEHWGENLVKLGRNLTEPTVDDYDDDDDDEPESLTKEVSLDVKQLVVRRFADNTIVRNYCWLLKYYTCNSATTNYYVVRMLQRICEDRVLEPMLYQLSIFQTFYAILSDKQLCATKDHKFVVAFLTKVVRGFFKKLKSQPMLFIELLFWKLKHECANISADYMIHTLKRSINGASRGQRVNIADALGDDEDLPPPSKVDHDNDELSAESDLSGDDDQPDSPSSSESSPLSESQESLLKELFQKYKDEHDHVQRILLELVPSGGITAKQVESKLRRLGLVKRHVASKGKRTSNVGESNNHLGTREGRKLKRTAENSKRKKSKLFTESQDEELKKLFLRHGKSTKCARTIAESFGGVYTPAQISRRLRTLGLVKPKTKSRLERFLASVNDGGDVAREEEKVGELCTTITSNSVKEANFMNLSEDSDADDDYNEDDATLGSVFRSAVFQGGASTSGTQDEQQQPNTGPSRKDFKAILGRGARRKAGNFRGDFTTGASNECVPDNRFSNDMETEEEGETNLDGSLTNVREKYLGEGIPGSGSDHLPSDALYGCSMRVITQAEDHHEELLPVETRASGLSASRDRNGQQRSGGVSSEVNAVVCTEEGKELDNVTIPNDSMVTSGSEGQAPPEAATDGESFQRKVSKRRRLNKKLASSLGSEDENQVAGELPAREVFTEESTLDWLNDF